jgi:hypothetical protein
MRMCLQRNIKTGIGALKCVGECTRGKSGTRGRRELRDGRYNVTCQMTRELLTCYSLARVHDECECFHSTSRHLTCFFALILLSGKFLVPTPRLECFFCPVSNFVFTQSNAFCVSLAFLLSVPSLNQTEEDVISLVKQSLSNLQTDYIDL